MNAIGAATFGIVLLALGVVCLTNPSGIRLVGERFGGLSLLNERTVDRSIRMSGVIAIIMAAFVFWALMYAR